MILPTEFSELGSSHKNLVLQKTGDSSLHVSLASVPQLKVRVSEMKAQNAPQIIKIFTDCSLLTGQSDNYVQNSASINLNQPASCFSLTATEQKFSQNIAVAPLRIDYSKTVITVATQAFLPLSFYPPLTTRTSSLPIEPVLLIYGIFLAVIVTKYKYKNGLKAIVVVDNFLPRKIVLLC